MSQGCYDSFYPFQLFPLKKLEDIEFADITIFCGGNGSAYQRAVASVSSLRRWPTIVSMRMDFVMVCVDFFAPRQPKIAVKNKTGASLM